MFHSTKIMARLLGFLAQYSVAKIMKMTRNNYTNSPSNKEMISRLGFLAQYLMAKTSRKS